MGQFQKGEGGRPKGSPNKITTELREWVSNFLQDNLEQIQSDWMALQPKDRIMLFEKLLRYALPTLQSMQFETEFERLPDDQLDAIIESLKHSTV